MSVGFKVCVDPELKLQQAAVSALTDKLSFSWVSAEVLTHSSLVALLACVVFTLYSVESGEEPTITMMPHVILGVVLGLLLVARVVVGAQRAADVLAQILAFHKSLRVIAVFSTHVGETLTIAAGAEQEKRAIGNFRYDLVRLLNLCNFCYVMMLKGQKLEETPATLCPTEGGKLESKVLSTVGSPTLMVCKYIASLFEQAKSAGRVASEQVAATQAELSSLADVYHRSRGMQLTPMPAAFSSFTQCFVVLWVYTACPVIAVAELHDNSATFNTVGTAVTFVMSFVTALFYFGLYEAGKLMESPVESTIALIPLEAISYNLSEDLTNLTDDPDQAVPVFLSPVE